MAETFDVAVIGLGAAGSALGKVLADLADGNIPTEDINLFRLP